MSLTLSVTNSDAVEQADDNTLAVTAKDIFDA
jgi:hypothetical protein